MTTTILAAISCVLLFAIVVDRLVISRRHLEKLKKEKKVIDNETGEREVDIQTIDVKMSKELGIELIDALNGYVKACGGNVELNSDLATAFEKTKNYNRLIHVLSKIKIEWATPRPIAQENKIPQPKSDAIARLLMQEEEEMRRHFMQTRVDNPIPDQVQLMIDDQTRDWPPAKRPLTSSKKGNNK